MAEKTQPKPALNPALKAGLEYGPIAAFLIAYFIYRDASVELGRTTYGGLVAVTAGFVPIFLVATGLLWALTGRIARIQIVLSVFLIIFAALGVWMNDPRLFQMKPTVIYGLLALFLGVGLLRGQSWLRLIMESVVPLEQRGWMILTRRVTVLFALSAAANELVWRTQSEIFWVYFETLAMPAVIVVFFLAQIPLFIDHAKLGPTKKQRQERRRRRQRRQKRAAQGNDP
ncbi:MAG: septation protein IspZ [Pseudomonadota bacterium]